MYLLLPARSHLVNRVGLCVSPLSVLRLRETSMVPLAPRRTVPSLPDGEKGMACGFVGGAASSRAMSSGGAQVSWGLAAEINQASRHRVETWHRLRRHQGTNGGHCDGSVGGLLCLWHLSGKQGEGSSLLSLGALFVSLFLGAFEEPQVILFLKSQAQWFIEAGVYCLL